MTNFLEWIHNVLWGIPMLVLIVGVGIYLSLRTGFVQFRLFPRALRFFLTRINIHDSEPGQASSFRALCTALAATVGTGNLVGVAGAICLGGPGAVFWMWVSGFFGMVTKYAEILLAQRFRVRSNGEILGGPMYVICRGLGSKMRPLASAYCWFGVIAAFGVGNLTQINSVVTGLNEIIKMLGSTPCNRYNLGIGLILSVMIGIMLYGGSVRIGAAAELLVPFVSLAYIFLCLAVFVGRKEYLLSAVASIFSGAFSPSAVCGGMIGSVFQTIRIGCARGVFTNEAGMGTASLAHASACVSHPVEQGFMGMVEVFLDTIVMCTLTAVAILVSGIPIPYGNDLGGLITFQAFSQVCGEWVSWFLSGALCCFAFATVLGWGLYGARCAQFLFGKSGMHLFFLLQTIAVIPGALMNTGMLWLIAEIMNAMMAIPNLIALAMLTPEVVRLTIDYIKSDRQAVGGGTYADFYQCKPL